MQQPFPNGSDFRKQAREALKPDLTTALTIAFLASLPSLICSTVLSINVSPVLTNLQTQLLQYYNETGITLGAYMDKAEAAMIAAVTNPSLIFAVALYALVFILTPFLELGLIASAMKLLRKEPVSIGTVLCRSASFLKAIGLRLYMILRVFLWLLPGIGVTLLSIPVTLWTRSYDVFMLIYFAGFAVMAVLGIRALLSYAMAKPLLADHPSARIRDCVHDSVLIMHRRRKDLILLLVFFLVLGLAAELAADLFAGISSVIGMVVQMALNLVLNLYMTTSVAAFYMHYEKQPLQM